MPRSLAARLVAAFVGLALVVMLVVGAALFVVLRSLEGDAATARLEDVAGSVLPQVREAVGTGDLRGTILDVRDSLAGLGIQVMVIGADGRLRPLGGPAEGDPVLASDLAVGVTDRGSVTLDGRSYLWVATGLRKVNAAAPKALAFVTLDRSGAVALADLGRAVPAVLLVSLLVFAPLAWLLARGVTRPLRRLAAAAEGLPSAAASPLPLEGPSEVRDLTMTFNAMAGELADTRRREAELLANLRHDLRTPLTVISGFATALRDGTATGDAAAAAARAIKEEAGRLERLVGELGEVERLRGAEADAAGLRPEPLDVGEVIAATIERFADRAEREGVALAAGPLPAGLDRGFAADELAVERMLGNLVVNALAATPAGGQVELDARETTVGGRPAIAIDVLDSGPGFPAGQAERAFERFWRAEPSRAGGGSGLGLAIVRELARAHGGDAYARNESPTGARVGIILPRVPPIAPRA